MPWFEEFSTKYQDKGLAVLGVSLDDGGWKAIQPVVGKLQITYPIVLGDDKFSKSYGVGVDSPEMPIPSTDSVASNNRSERESHHRMLIDADSPASSTAAASLL